LEDPESDPHLWTLQILNSLFTGEITISLIIGLAVVLILIACSAMLSGSEIAFFSLNPAQLKIIEQDETKSHRMIILHLKKPKRLLATILIANNFVNVGIVILSAFVSGMVFNFADYPILGIVIEIVAITFMILLFGEIMPKIYANQKPVAFASFMALPLNFMMKFFYPLSSMLVRTTRLIDKKLASQSQAISMTELSDAIDITSKQQENPEEETKILKGIVKFHDIEVSEIMRSRMDVIAIDTATLFTDVVNIVTESGYSRIPVFTETFDNIDGILYVKDLLPHLGKSKTFNWQELVRPAFYVPENKKINDLLQEIREKKIHLAIVVDEYGGTSGIVTLEDVLEEIVGEISDEFDSPEDEVEFNKIDEHTYIFEGRTSINDFCKIIGVEDHIFDSVKGDADSLAGLVLELLGRMPEKNATVSFKEYEFKVLTVDKRRIKMINVFIHDKKAKQNA
jgi:gliding motility-associated protein GldE